MLWEENYNLKYTIFDQHCFFVKFKAPNHQELTDFVLNKEEVYHQYDWTEICEINTIKCTWQETIQLLTPSVNQFASSIGKSFKWTIYNPWINCYQKGQFQEIHDHLQYDFSCVFFPKVEENFSQFYFYNRYANSLSKSWLNLFGGVSSWDPIVESGDIIFFPGTLLHGVTPHKSDEVRKTLSCNFDFDLSN